MQPARYLEQQFDQLLIEFQQATAEIWAPDPELGALIRAAYELDGELPPLRLVRAA